MKRMMCGFLAFLLGFVVMGRFAPPVATGGSLHQVSFTASFCTHNLEIDSQSDHNYGGRIGFGTEILGQEDYQFAFWIVNGHVRFDLPVDHDFIINGPMEINALFSHDSTYAVVFMDTNGAMLDIQYVEENDNAVPPAIGTLPDKPGYVIDAEETWSASHEGITGHTVLILQYELSSEATFEIAVTNGAGAGTKNYNTIVEVTADPPAGEDVFLYWEEDGIKQSFSEVYRFTALRERNLTAVYGAEAWEEAPLVTLSPDLEIRTNHASYAGQFFVPEDHTLIEYGLLRSNTNSVPVHDSPDATRHRGHKYQGATGEFLMSFATPMVYQRAYLVTEDGDDELHYTYSTVVETSTYQIDLSADHPGAIVDVIEDPPYFHGDIVTITASSVPGYNFLYWYDLDENSVYSTELSPSLLVTRNYDLEARYQDEDIIFSYDFSELSALPSGWSYSKTYTGGSVRFDANNDYLRSETISISQNARVTIEYTGYGLDDEYLNIKDANNVSHWNNYPKNGTNTITFVIDFWVTPNPGWLEMQFVYYPWGTGYILIHTFEIAYD